MVLVAQRLLNGAAAVDDAASVDLGKVGATETTHTIEWSEGVSVGVVEIEGASSVDYTGAWFPVQTVTFDGSTTAAPKVEIVNLTGTWAALRHRISTPLDDGTVSSRVDASGAW